MRPEFGLWSWVGLLLALGSTAVSSVGAELPNQREGLGVLCVGLRLDEEPQPMDPFRGVLRLTPATTSSTQSATASEDLEIAVSIPGDVEIPVPSGSGWVAYLEAPGLWMAPHWLEEEAEGPLELRPMRAGEIAVPLRGADEGSLPARAEATFMPSPEGSKGPGKSRLAEGPRGSAICSISGGSARCALPRGEMDLRLETPGYAPVYLWNVRVQPNERAELEPAHLVRGASLSGWIVLPRQEGEARKRMKVELAPRVQARGTSSEVRERLTLQTVTTSVEDNGFFQIAGLEAGAYALRVSMDGLAPARRFPIWISGHGEDRLDAPIELGPPSELRASIDPPTDPFSRVWRLSVQRESEISERLVEVVREGLAEPDGSYLAGDLPPGRYNLSVESGDGTQWLEEPFELEAGEALDLFVPVSLVEVTGIARLGKEPLEGRLSFSHRKLGASIPMTADEDGEFHGYLPREGEWRVSMRPIIPDGTTPTLELKVAVVEVRRVPGGRAAELEITFPATRIEGEVIDRDGDPVSEAVVTAWASDGPSADRLAASTRVEEGRFSLIGLPAGTVALEAQAESGARAGPTIVNLEPDRTLDSVVLVVRETLEIEALLMSSGRPVPYGSIRARITDPATGALTSLWAATATSDAAGRAILRVPEGELDLLVSAASCATTLLSIPTARLRELAEEGLRLDLASTGGTLLFDVSAIVSAADPEATGQVILYHGGGSATFEELLRLNAPEMIAAERLAMTRMAPGMYTVCQAWPDGRTACSDGFLPSGGELGIVLETRDSAGKG